VWQASLSNVARFWVLVKGHVYARVINNFSFCKYLNNTDKEIKGSSIGNPLLLSKHNNINRGSNNVLIERQHEQKEKIQMMTNKLLNRNQMAIQEFYHNQMRSSNWGRRRSSCSGRAGSYSSFFHARVRHDSDTFVDPHARFQGLDIEPRWAREAKLRPPCFLYFSLNCFRNSF
jgi:hypothetical protein